MMEENENADFDEVEVWEFTLDNEEIDELVEKLKLLKETKKNFEFDVDDENMLLVHHTEDEGVNEDE